MNTDWDPKSNQENAGIGKLSTYEKSTKLNIMDNSTIMESTFGHIKFSLPGSPNETRPFDAFVLRALRPVFC